MENLINFFESKEVRIILISVVSFFLILWFIKTVNKEHEIEKQRQKAYWTKERLAEYEQAKNESEENGIPY